MARRFETRSSRVLPASRDLAWSLASDSNRFDRAMGLSAGRYEWKTVDGKRQHVAQARELGLKMSWVEPPYEWVEGSWVKGSRRFLEGPVSTGGFETHFETVDEDHTRVSFCGYVTADGPVGWAAAKVQQNRFRTGMAKFFDAMEQAIRGLGATERGSDASMMAQRALLGRYESTLSGQRSAFDRDAFDRRSQRLREAPVAHGARERLLQQLQEAADDHVTQMRPFELADVWSLGRQDVLAAFLHATRCGLTDLQWQINCPVCRVSASFEDSMEKLGGRVHCEACDVSYEVEFDKHVEAIFKTHPALRDVQPQLFCASSPSFLPHIFAQLRVGPESELEVAAPDFPGELLLRVLREPGASEVTLSDEPSRGLEVVFSSRGLAARPNNKGTLRFENQTGSEQTLMVERAGDGTDRVLGATLARFPEFLDLFATEAPASGVELTVGEMTLLFSDLVGSTALYERVGDAKAFAIVERHFRVMERIIREHRGAVIKTMGDAVMASFESPGGAAQAAVDIVSAHASEPLAPGLGVKLGLHTGPCLAVRANGRLDFFGTTVNVAARLQAKAAAGEIVLLAQVAAFPEVSRAFDTFPSEGFDAELRGIHETQRLQRVALHPRPGAVEPPSC